MEEVSETCWRVSKKAGTWSAHFYVSLIVALAIVCFHGFGKSSPIVFSMQNVQRTWNQTPKIDLKYLQNRAKMESKWGPRAFLRAYQDEVRFGNLILPFWGPSGGQVGLMLATFSGFWVSKTFFERSSFPTWFWSDFEAIWEPRGGAKTSVSLQRGFSFQLYVIFSFYISFSSISEAKMEPKSSQNGVQERL